MVALLVVMVPAAALGTPAAQQSGGNFIVSVAGTAAGSIPHQIDLKVTQLPGGQLSEVSGFAVSPEDVIQVKRGENLIVSTSPDLMTHQVTVRNIQGIPIDLVQLPSNAWSLQGLLPGVYTLDVNVAMSSSSIFGTYETILVILEPNQQPLPPTTVISQITIEESQDCPGNSRLVNGTCVEPSPPPPPPPCDPNEQVPGEECVCPEGISGTPPNCEPINCDVEDPPPECEEPPCTEPECAPTECPDGQIVPPGEECPEEDPPEEDPPEEDPPEEDPPEEEEPTPEEEEVEAAEEENGGGDNENSMFG
jgi:hypothetical protein